MNDNLESVQVIKRMYSRFGYKNINNLNFFIYIMFFYLFLNYIQITTIKLYLNQTNVNIQLYNINLYNINLYNINLYNIFYSFMIGSVIIPFFIYQVSKFYKSGKIWDFIFKENYPINLISSAEKRNNEFIKYPINTYSSTFLFNIGCYMIIRSNKVYNKISSLWLGNIMNIMGLFSILWWSSSKKIIRKFDNLFMEVHLLYLSLYYISLVYKEYTTYLNVFIVLYGVFRYYYINNARIVILFILENIMSIWFCIKYKNTGDETLYYLGNVSILFGCYFKIKDYLMNYKYGTGLFHIFAPLSILFHYEWAQTVIY